MKTIYKYKILPGKNILTLPRRAVVHSAAIQNGDVVVWVMLDINDNDVSPREIYVAVTGQVLPDYDDIRHIATLNDEGFVVHILEIER